MIGLYAVRWCDLKCFGVPWWTIDVFKLFSVIWKLCTIISTVMNLYFFDLMEAYHCVVVLTPPLHFVTSVFHKRLLSSVFRGINKGCAKTSCLYSSTRVSTSLEVLICCSWQDTGVYHGHPPLEHHSPYAESPQTPLHGPSAWMNTHEYLLSPPEIRVWML